MLLQVILQEDLYKLSIVSKMAEREREQNSTQQNWEKRCYSSYGPDFRIDSGNPQMGISGENVYQIYGVTDEKDQCHISLSKSGHYKILNDRSIEITAGNKSEEEGVDIALNAIDGGISLSCLRNGAIQLKARNIILDAVEDIDIKAGRNLSLTAGSTLKLKGMKVEVDESSIFGNLVESALGSFGEQVFAETAAMASAGADAIKTGLSIGANLAKTVGETPLAEVASQTLGAVNVSPVEGVAGAVAIEFPEEVAAQAIGEAALEDGGGEALTLF